MRPATPAAPDIGLVLLTLNQRDKTMRCLRSLEQVSHVSFRIAVWDNGSTDGTAALIAEEFPDVLVQRSPVNLGVASGRNAGVRLARRHGTPRFYCFIDNDMIVEPDFLDELVRPFQSDPGLAVTTGKIRCLGDEKRLYGAAGCVLDFRFGRTGHVGHGELDEGQYDSLTDCLPSGGCMLVRADVFERLGGFSAEFDPYGPEDLDFGLRVRQLGMHSHYVPGAVLYHEATPGHTFSGGMKSSLHVRTKTRLWFVLLRRHASLSQRLFFFTIGAPLTLARALVREVRRGNGRRLVLGLARGLWDNLRRRGRPVPVGEVEEGTP
jgi:GT2 family glycosyltransferase